MEGGDRKKESITVTMYRRQEKKNLSPQKFIPTPTDIVIVSVTGECFIRWRSDTGARSTMRALLPRRAETDRKRRRMKNDADLLRRRCAHPATTRGRSTPARDHLPRLGHSGHKGVDQGELDEDDEEGGEAGMRRMIRHIRSYSINMSPALTLRITR